MPIRMTPAVMTIVPDLKRDAQRDKKPDVQGDAEMGQFRDKKRQQKKKSHKRRHPKKHGFVLFLLGDKVPSGMHNARAQHEQKRDGHAIRTLFCYSNFLSIFHSILAQPAVNENNFAANGMFRRISKPKDIFQK
jgi:hypothetical protein